MKWLRKQVNESRFLEPICIGVAIGIIFGIIYQTYFNPIVEVAHAEEEVVVEETPPMEVMVEVVYTKEDIIRRIEETFPESPNTAVAIAKCESGLRINVQSNHTLSYGRELSFGLFQIHSPAWDKRAKALGYEDYRDDLEDNLAMARYIYESAGKSWTPWSCLKMI